MDDRLAAFYIAVGGICEDAERAELEVTVERDDDIDLVGVPRPPAANRVDELDDTGFADALVVDGVQLALHAVEAITLRRPEV